MFAPPILACPEAESAWEGATNLWNYLDSMIIRNKKNQNIVYLKSVLSQTVIKFQHSP